ncbi:MAG: hypothetical protein IPH11_15600 [Ignavibacteriales bacterium]|nr:hypothetical protein [Ignavibacteriales bacterium]
MRKEFFNPPTQLNINFNCSAQTGQAPYHQLNKSTNLFIALRPSFGGVWRRLLHNMSTTPFECNPRLPDISEATLAFQYVNDTIRLQSKITGYFGSNFGVSICQRIHSIAINE